MWRDIQLDVDIKKKNYLNIEANQADDLLLTIYLYNNGVPLNLVSGEDTVIVNYVNANNTITSNSDIGKGLTGNQLKLYCPRNCTNSAGIAKMQVTINTDKQYTANKQVTTFPIEVKVNKSVVDGQEVSTNVNSMLSSLNSANIKGQQVIKNITETATKYPTSSQLYADVEDLKVREYGAENLLQDSGFLSGNIGSGFPWNVYNSNTTAITAASDSAYSGKSVRITSTTGEAGIKQYIIYNRASTVKDFKNAYTASFRIYGIKGTVIKVALSNAQMKTYTIKAENTWEDVVITFDTNINNWDKGFCIVSSSATNFYLQDVALWEGRNAFSFKYNSQECLYDRIRISGQDVLAITKSGKYAGVGCTNNPFGNNNEWAYYDIDVHSTTYKKIIARSYNRNTTYENTLNNGTWTGWIDKNKLASYTQDSTHRLISDAEKNVWNMVTGNGTKQQNSYLKLPSGIIMQWGVTSLDIPSGGAITREISYPITFPNKCFFVMANATRNITTNSATGVENIVVNGVLCKGNTDKSKVTITGRDCVGSGQTWTFEIGWFAIGY